ncbi:MAG: hypothetical protein AAF762_00185 [Pseudomonadota bacterium]
MKTLALAGVAAAALVVSGCETITADDVLADGLEFASLATAYGVTLDGELNREEASPYIRAAVEVWGDRIPARYVGTAMLACGFVDLTPDLAETPEVVSFCEALMFIEAPA